ncbi:S8 family peptidase [Streptomyces sp. 4N509B]|uniref:S8 family peptidase n=1 Tax=Streptomyces sp. 4N509B TaxID=3457413 RepID=UPI003FD1DA1E
MAFPITLRRRRTAGLGAATVAAAALALGVMPATSAGAAEQPEGTILYADAPNAVDGSYVVTLHASRLQAETAAGTSLAERYGAEITHTYTAALNGYAIEASEAEARRLAADPAVASVVQDRTFTIQGTQPNPPSWGLDRLDQAELPLDRSYTYPDSAGEGVTAYIIDTGVRITHGDFGGRASYGYDAVDGDTTAQDGNGHGTHVAGTVAGSAYGVAKNADIVAVRVLNNAGSGTTAGVIAGVDWVTENAQHPAVANMSLGGGVDASLDQAVRNSIASGVTYTLAAGNDNVDASRSSPARVTEAITVGSSTSTDARSSFSNYGSVLDLFAPGSSITSAWHTSDSASNTISGTSMAAPHVAGAAALHLAENPDDTPAQVASALTGSAVSGNISNPGTGSPNRLLNVGEGGGTPPDPGPSFDNTTAYRISDHATVESTITVSGIDGNGPASLGVPVNISHTYIGDLTVELEAPNGTVFTLAARQGGSANDILTTYAVNASSVPANGTWTLRVTDSATYDTGTLNSWGLRF